MVMLYAIEGRVELKKKKKKKQRVASGMLTKIGFMKEITKGLGEV